jgi:hypothetical protein
MSVGSFASSLRSSAKTAYEETTNVSIELDDSTNTDSLRWWWKLKSPYNLLIFNNLCHLQWNTMIIVYNHHND